MSSSLKHTLNQWYPNRDNTEWVLCTLYKTEGSSYRRTGAMMMFSADGQQLGLLSGGCLEGDIQRRAKAVIANQMATTITYDATDEDDLTFQLGIGCGGIVHILMQPISASNQYLALDKLRDILNQGGSGLYCQHIPSQQQMANGYLKPIENTQLWSIDRKSQLVTEDNQQWLHTQIFPEPHLLIVGGGYDARPLVSMANSLGWTTSIWDPRPANARKAYFPQVDNIISSSEQDLLAFSQQHQFAGIILMSHSVGIDAQALKVLHQSPVSYFGLLGPEHRKQQVIEQSTIDIKKMNLPIAGPIGLNIGGDTPESIALAVLAEIHAVIGKRNGQSISGIVN